MNFTTSEPAEPGSSLPETGGDKGRQAEIAGASNDMLMGVFAQFGVDFNNRTPESKKEGDNDAEQEDDDKVKASEMSIPLPDFNTVDFKVKRILDMIPDFRYLI